jgi:epoxyqueuosine reductase
MSKMILEAFLKQFDAVGVIATSRYHNAAKALGITLPLEPFPTLVVVALSYPKRTMAHTKTHLIPSFYTFGRDYHTVLQDRIALVMKELNLPYHANVDNHPHDERLAATLAGIGFFGKNQLIISPTLGTYHFLGMVFLDTPIEEETIIPIKDDCGTCQKCLQACPGNALSEQGYDMPACLSYYNQTKQPLTSHQIDQNYCLFGCDICQLVCPKNQGKGQTTHPEFALSGKEAVGIEDLFTLSEPQFAIRYSDMAYLWKGKTILMRNAATILLKQNNNHYNDLMKASLRRVDAPWYHQSITRILELLESGIAPFKE